MNNCSDRISTVTKLKVGVHTKFAELRAALQIREKLLLRQLDAVATTKNQCMTKCSIAGAETTNLSTKSMLDYENDDIKILFENEDDLLGAIRTFGRFQLGSMLLTLKQEDYITPNCDHEIMYKQIQTDENSTQLDLLPQHERNSPETIIVDFSKDKSLIEHNTKYINNSIVNITLAEAKELINNARSTTIPLLNLEELDDELESSIAEAVSNLNRDSNSNEQSNDTDIGEKGNSFNNRSKVGNGRLKQQKITINNCSGTINLRNISSVTINCTGGVNDRCEHFEGNDKMQSSGTAESTLMSSKNSITSKSAIVTAANCVGACVSENSTPTSAESFSHQSSNSSSRSQSKKQKKGKMYAKDDDLSKKQNKSIPTAAHNPVTINDNIPNLQTGNTESSTITDARVDTTESKEVTCDFYNRLLNEIKRNLAEQNSTANSFGRNKKMVSLDKTLKKEPQLVLKNFENLNIVLKNDTQFEPIHPVHIEHWLSEIMKDTDLEPMQNTDILEHSKLNE